MPNSSAICISGRPLDCNSATASRLNSSVKLRRSYVIKHPSCPFPEPSKGVHQFGGGSQYPLACLRYDLSKPRAKGLVEKPPRSRRYRLPAEGYSTCLIFLRLFQRVYVPSPLAFSARPRRCHVPTPQTLAPRSPLSSRDR